MHPASDLPSRGAPVHVWAHEMSSSRGGIQSYTRTLVRAADGLIGRATPVHLMRERPPGPGQSPLPGSVRSYGGHSERLRLPAFCLGATAWALAGRPGLLLSAHPNLSRLGVRVARLAGAKFWTAAHGVDVWEDCPESVRRALRRCDRVLAVSQFTRDALIRLHGLSPARVSVLPNSYDDSLFTIGSAAVPVRRKYDIPPGAPILLSVGRLAAADRMKGFDQVIRALPAILEKVPGCYYLIAGTGPDLDRLTGLARECGVSARVRFAGFVPDNELPDVYRLCDLFVMPGRKEGFGIVFLEALGCGRPVIAGNVDASGEPLLEGELGVLVNPGDCSEIAALCVQVLTRSHPNKSLYDPELLSRRAREEFGQARFKDRLEALFIEHLPQLFAPRPCPAPIPLCAS